VNNAGLNHKVNGDTVYNFWQTYHHLGGGVQSLLVKRIYLYRLDNDLFLVPGMVLNALKGTITMVLSEEKYEFLDENFGRIKKRLT
jgi:hypothetical protein